MNWAERFPRLWAFLEQVATLLFGSVLFWLSCLFVVTLPGGLVGLYAVLGPLVRSGKGDGEILRPFWAAFRRALLPGLGLLLLDLVAGLILWVDSRFFWSVGALWGRALAVVALALALLALMVNLFAWPLLAWYPQPLRKLLWRAFLLTGAHPLLAMAGVVLLIGMLLLYTLLPGALMGLVPALGPGLLVGLLGAIAWRAMRTYEVEEEGR